MGRRRRDEEVLDGGGSKWRRVEERWSKRTCAGVEDGDSWLTEQGAPKRSRKRDGVVHGQEYRLSRSLAALLQAEWLSRPEAARRLFAHCKEAGMLNPHYGGEIIFSRRLAKLFRQPTVRVSRLLDLLTPHFRQPKPCSEGAAPEEEEEDSTPPHDEPSSSAGAITLATPLARRCNVKKATSLARRQVSGKDDDLDSLEEDAAILEQDGTVPPSQVAQPEPSPLDAATGARPPLTRQKQPQQQQQQQQQQRQQRGRLGGEVFAEEAATKETTQEVRKEAKSAKIKRELSSSVSATPDPPSVSAPGRSSGSLAGSARGIVVQLSHMEPDAVKVTMRCRPHEEDLRFEVLARPVSAGGGQRPASRREPCVVRLKEAASGGLEPHGEVILSGLDPELAYRIAVEMRAAGGSGGSSHTGHSNRHSSHSQVARSAEVTLPQRACPLDWAPQEVLQWCLTIKVPEFARKAEEYAIDGATLLSLGEEDIRALGITAPFLLKRVQRTLKALREWVTK